MISYVPRPYVSHRDSGGEAAGMQKPPQPPVWYGPHASSEWLAGYHDQMVGDLKVEQSELDHMKDDDIIAFDDVEDQIRDHRGQRDDALEVAAAIRDRVARTLPPLDVLLAAMPDGLRTTAEWPSRYEVSDAILRTGLLAAAEVQSGEFMLCYGTYHGHVDASSPFADRGKGLSRHGWLETIDGIVLDATRWVFTGSKPMLHLDTITDYDLGATRTRMAHRSRRPEFEVEKCTPIVASADALAEMGRLLGDQALATRGTIGNAQAFWLGTLHLEVLGAMAPVIFAALEDSGLAGIVPTDHKAWCDQQIRQGIAA